MATTKANNPLLGSKRREVAQRVLAAGFPKGEFDFMEMQASEIITALVYLPDRRYRFDFYPGDNWTVDYSPAEHTSSSGMQGVGDWENVLVRVDWWLSYLKRELDVTDPWAAFAESVEPFNVGGDGTNNEPFSAAEQAAIIERIEQVRVFLLDAEGRSEQDRHIIMERLDYLSDAVGRLGRLDWRNVAVGAVIDLGILGYVEPGSVRHVVEFIVGAVQRLLPA